MELWALNVALEMDRVTLPAEILQLIAEYQDLFHEVEQLPPPETLIIELGLEKGNLR